MCGCLGFVREDKDKELRAGGCGKAQVVVKETSQTYCSRLPCMYFKYLWIWTTMLCIEALCHGW